MAETNDLKSLQCRFESDQGYAINIVEQTLLIKHCLFNDVAR